MISIDSEISINPDVIFSSLENGEVVLLLMPETTHFSLNQTGARIWASLAGGQTLVQTADRLAREFDITPDRAEQSVVRLVEKLLEAGLVHDASVPID